MTALWKLDQDITKYMTLRKLYISDMLCISRSANTKYNVPGVVMHGYNGGGDFQL